MKNRKSKGFTIIELICVMAIIAVLTLMALPNLTDSISDAESVSDTALVRSTYIAVQSYCLANKPTESINLSADDLEPYLQSDAIIVSGLDQPNCNEYGHYEWGSSVDSNTPDMMCVHLILEGGQYKGAGITSPTTKTVVVIELYDPTAEKINEFSEPNIRYYQYNF